MTEDTKTTAAPDDPDRCEFCEAGMKPVKLRRQYVHPQRRLGRLAICSKVGLKRASA